jgi:prolyl oligopeptidase
MEDLPDLIRWCKFSSIAWRHDNTGFWYARFPEPGTVAPEDQSYYHRVYWHALHTDQRADELVFERPDAKELGYNPLLTDDGRYLVLDVWHGTDPRNRLYYRPVEGGEVVRLLDEGDAMYRFVDSVGDTFYIHTDHDAPRGRIIAIDLDRPEREHWQEIVAQSDDPIDFVTMSGDHLVVAYKHDVKHQLHIFDLEGTPQGTLPTSGVGATGELSGKRSSSELFWSWQSFLEPPSIYRHDWTDGSTTLFRRPQVAFDAVDYETTQVFYPSKDGTRIPMFITHRKNLPLDGDHPTLLYGYGGFNISLMPAFSAIRLAWLEAGGVLAVANLRGGDEYGEAWHLAGMLDRKQNVFDDYIAAAEWLIANGYTNNRRLAINGGSNGGLLVSATMLQRPDLFGAVVCQVPVTDMLHYHRWTVGRYWVPEYGNAEEHADHFRWMYAYSPLHNVRPGATYPPMLITSADTDDRVVPAHAKKLAAALQAANPDNTILLRVETKAGHGAGKPTTKIIEEAADIYAFLFWALGMEEAT